jgi:hypothetical protein
MPAWFAETSNFVRIKPMRIYKGIIQLPRFAKKSLGDFFPTTAIVLAILLASFAQCGRTFQKNRSISQYRLRSCLEIPHQSHD